MAKIQRLQSISIRTLILLVSLVVATNLPFAQDASIDIPKNAHPKKYGSRGWECDLGYREINKTCEAVNVPENAYLTDSFYGRGWECERGYKRVDEICIAIEVPPNAYLEAEKGDSWRCNRGYKKVNETCILIKVPKNGYLTNSSHGSGWECDRGFRAVDGTCVAIKVPKKWIFNEFILWIRLEM